MTQSSALKPGHVSLLLLFLLLFSAPRRMNQHAAAENGGRASHEAHRAKTKCLHQWN
jgi:hypothetical protein